MLKSIFKTKSVLFLFFVIILVVTTSCKSEKEKMEERSALIDSVLLSTQQNLYAIEIDSLLKKSNFNGIISIYKDSTKVYEGKKGFRDFKNKKPFGSNDIFAIASNSKQITASLILRLQKQGKLKVTDKVLDYLDDYNKSGYNKITIHQLLNHSSGRNDFGAVLLSEPGKKFNYSNKGYNDLGRIIEKVTGKSYEENIANLFKELGMGNSFTSSNFRDGSFASAYVGNLSNPQEVKEMPKRLSRKNIGNPAGGILSSVEDLHLWNNLLYSGKVVDSLSLLAMTKSTINRKHIFSKVGYGYGLHICNGNPKSYYHTGFVRGAPSLTIYYPQTHLSVVILSNYANTSHKKERIFKPHFQVKEWCDDLELTMFKVKKQFK